MPTPNTSLAGARAVAYQMLLDNTFPARRTRETERLRLLALRTLEQIDGGTR